MAREKANGSWRGPDPVALQRRIDELERINTRLGKQVAAMETEQQRLRSLLENMPVMVDALDAEDRIIFWNRECERLTGYSAQEIVGKPEGFELLYPNAAAREAMFQEFKRRGRDFRNWELELTCKDGSTRQVLWFNISDKFPVSGWASWAIGVDITERKRLEEDVREREEMLRALLNAATESILLVDREGRILTLNETAAERLWGPSDVLIGQGPLDCDPRILPSATVRERMAAVRKVFDTGAAVRLRDERTGICFDASMHPVFDGDGEVCSVAIFAKDISEQTRLERELRESEERYRTVVESAGEAIAVVDASGVFCFMNSTAARQFDGPPGTLVGKTMWDLFPKDVADGQMCRVEAVIRTGTAWNATTMFRLGNEPRWYNTTISPLKDGAGNVTAGLVIARDIHELKQAQDELDAYRERMNRAEQLASLGTLSATLAHELTQPLTVIRLSIQNSLKGLESTSCRPMVLEDLREGLEEVASAVAIIERFRTFARRSSREVCKEVALSDVAERIVRVLAESAQRAGITFDVRGLRDVPPIRARERDLEQLFFAIMQNAVQAAVTREDSRLELTATTEGDRVELRFKDNCGGVAPENLAHIFEPFFTTKLASEGTGLGLCIAQRVVSLAGGHIRVESQVGEGTTFVVTLPIRGD